jgi:hypothetical protein
MAVIDNWDNRRSNMVCLTCMYFVNFRCRRHAPTMQGFPAMYQTDWCGDHKLDKHNMTPICQPKEDTSPNKAGIKEVNIVQSK